MDYTCRSNRIFPATDLASFMVKMEPGFWDLVYNLAMKSHVRLRYSLRIIFWAFIEEKHLSKRVASNHLIQTVTLVKH